MSKCSLKYNFGCHKTRLQPVCAAEDFTLLIITHMPNFTDDRQGKPRADRSSLFHSPIRDPRGTQTVGEAWPEGEPMHPESDMLVVYATVPGKCW